MSSRTRPVYTPIGGPPQGPRPPEAIFHALGVAGVFELLEAFYVQLGQSSISELFPNGSEALTAASQRSAAFFVQLLGGPPLFSQHFGPPRMRARHIPFEIDEQAREVWLACFEATLDLEGPRLGFPDGDRAAFRAFLVGFSAWMVNVS